MLRFLLSALIVLMVTGTCDAQFNGSSRHPDKALFGKSSVGKKQKKIKEPKAVQKARKKQEKNQKDLKKDYEKSVEENKKRSYEIQSPDVKARMKQNEKDIVVRDKAKKKNVKSGSRKAAKKYN